MSSSTVLPEYIQAVSVPSDINEHVPTFRELTHDCTHITEMGIRTAVSTWGYLQGLIDNQRSDQTLVGVDLVDLGNVSLKIKDVCQKHDIRYNFIKGDSAKVDLEETDLLFIDTWHVYGHLKRELEKHHRIVRKYIVMHDTQVDAEKGETLRMGDNPRERSRESGYPVEEIIKGLRYAVEEFLASNPQFKVLRVYTNNNGLTVLQRVQTGPV